MIDIPTTVPVKKNKMGKPQQQELPTPDARQLMHEVFNQLTVINLCCFKFRNAVAPFINVQLLADVERMEKAVADLGALLENLPRSKPQAPVAVPLHRDLASGSPPPPSASVYALVNSSRRRR